MSNTPKSENNYLSIISEENQPTSQGPIITNNNLIFLLTQKNRLIATLNIENQKHLEQILILKSQLSRLKDDSNNSIRIQNELKKYKDKNEELQKEIEKLNNIIIDLKKNYTEEKSKMEQVYLSEIGQLNASNDNNTRKIEIDYLRSVNKDLIYQVSKLDQEKNDIKKEKEDTLRQKEIKNQMKFSKLKNKMMDNVNQTQLKVAELNVQYMDVSTKLTLLQNHQLLIQLEYLQQQLENYTSKNELLEKKIKGFKKDMEIHKEVELSLAEKNKKLQKELDKLKNNKSDDENIVEKAQLINTEKNGEKNNLNKVMNLEKKVIDLEKKLQNKQKEFNCLKDKNDSIEKILKNYEQKYKGLFNFLDNCLEDFINDKGLKQNNISINIDSLKNGDFNSFTQTEKYSVLVILMKYLLPLINNYEINNNNNFLNNVKINFKNQKPDSKKQIFNEIDNINHGFRKLVINKLGIKHKIIGRSNSSLAFNSFDNLPSIAQKSPLSPKMSFNIKIQNNFNGINNNKDN